MFFLSDKLSGVQHQQKLCGSPLSTTLLQHIADPLWRTLSVRLSLHHSLSLTHARLATHTKTHTLQPHKLICHPAYTNVPFLTAQLLSVIVCVCVCVRVHQGATNP